MAAANSLAEAGGQLPRDPSFSVFVLAFVPGMDCRIGVAGCQRLLLLWSASDWGFGAFVHLLTQPSKIRPNSLLLADFVYVQEVH
jgi:hypothetical protein